MTWQPLTERWDTDLEAGDPLGFPGYEERLAQARKSGAPDGVDESVTTGRTEHYVLIESEFEFLGGSMGVVHGERVVRAFRRAVELRLPVVCVIRTGGARMQEGMVSLVQLARTAAAQQEHAAAGLLSVALFRSPTTGGVLASYGSLCDLRAAERGAVVGFAGPRVAQETVGEAVGGRSHTAEHALAAGLVDAVVEPEDALGWVESALGLRDTPLIVGPRRASAGPTAVDELASVRGAWGEVLRARAADRPTGIDVAAAVCDSWTELRGTDPVTRAGLATVDGRRVVVIAHDRHAASGRPTPAGFRLARRAIELGGRLGLRVLTFVDTPGADAGADSENDGIASEIARTFAAMATTTSPTVSVCVGEGGSGGALALAAADRLLVQQHAVFSVIGPEGAAVILDRDPARAPEAAERLGLTSADLSRLGIADMVVPDDLAATADAVRAALRQAVPGDRARRLDAVSLQWLT